MSSLFHLSIQIMTVIEKAAGHSWGDRLTHHPPGVGGITRLASVWWAGVNKMDQPGRLWWPCTKNEHLLASFNLQKTCPFQSLTVTCWVFFLYKYLNQYFRSQGTHLSEWVCLMIKDFVWAKDLLDIFAFWLALMWHGLAPSRPLWNPAKPWEGATPCLANHVSGWGPVLCPRLSSALSAEATNADCRLSRGMALFTHTVWILE